jgi:hypothetical protein
MLCEICKKKELYTRCQGCGIAMCNDCTILELFGHGCGCIYPVPLCSKCYPDPAINPNAALEL